MQEYRRIYRTVVRLDHDLSQGLVHYRTRQGKLIQTLDQMLRAILNDDLRVENKANNV